MGVEKYAKPLLEDEQQANSEDTRSKRKFLRRLFAVLKSTVKEFGSDNASQHGAALSFFTVFALPPLLVLLVMLLSLFLDGSTVETQILDQVRRAAGTTSADVVETILENANKPGNSNFFAAAVSLGVLIFSASNVFAQLQSTLNTIWGVVVNPKVGLKAMLKTRLLSFGLILSTGFMVVVLLLIDLILAVLQSTLGAQLGILEHLHFFKLLNLGISFVLLTGVLATLFKTLPDVKIRWRDVAAGAVFTASLLSVSKFVISWYLSTSNMGSAYGAAGSTIIFLFWLYLNIQIFLLGAEFTESFAREFGSGLQPDKNAMWRLGYRQEAPSDTDEKETQNTEDTGATDSPSA